MRLCLREQRRRNALHACKGYVLAVHGCLSLILSYRRLIISARFREEVLEGADC